MCVEIITTGNEIMSGLTRDTNFSWVAAELSSSGIEVKHHCVVADDLEDLLASFAAASKRARFVIVTGGLGPTEDDLSALAASKFLGTSLVFNQAVYEDIARKLRKRGREPNIHHEKQAMFPEESDGYRKPRRYGCRLQFCFRQLEILLSTRCPEGIQANVQRTCLSWT